MSARTINRSNFRDNPDLVALVRLAITGMTGALPELSDELFQDWLMRYRESAGERTTDSVYSFAKMQFDQHLAQFRAQYPKVLGQYLISELDRAQGRAAAWPALDSEAPDLVSDRVMERRLAIDQLTRLVDVEADEGVRTFDLLLGEALGCSFASLRDDPLRPAVFFHTIGLTWNQVSGGDRDEIYMLSRYAPLFGPRVAALYPAMTKILRTCLDRPKPSGLNMLGATHGAPLYERRRQVPDKPSSSGKSSAPEHAPPDREPPDPWGRRSSDIALSGEHIEILLKRTDALAKHLEPAIACSELPETVRLMLARIQSASVRRFMINPALGATREDPFWRLVRHLGDVAAWRTVPAGHKQLPVLLMHLNIVREMLARDRVNSHRSGDEDATMYEHLAAQLLAMRKLPAARSISPEESGNEAESPAANDPRRAIVLARTS